MLTCRKKMHETRALIFRLLLMPSNYSEGILNSAYTRFCTEDRSCGENISLINDKYTSLLKVCIGAQVWNSVYTKKAGSSSEYYMTDADNRKIRRLRRAALYTNYQCSLPISCIMFSSFIFRCLQNA